MQALFEEIGGHFNKPFVEIADQLVDIRAYIFDWDGVFNTGVKGTDQHSGFSEPDAMGLNHLRFAHWLINGMIPNVGIISGADNPTALSFAKRERLQALYTQIQHKEEALIHFCKKFDLEPQQVAFCFDDVNDLIVAQKCGLRFLVQRKASPLMKKYTLDNKLCDYITAQEGGSHAVREICELVMAGYGNYNVLMEARIHFNQSYQNFFQIRQELVLEHFMKKNNEMIEIKYQ